MKLLAIVGAGFLLAVGWFFLISLVVMFAWNWAIPDVTKDAVTPLTYFQAICVTALCAFLFKGSTTVNKGD